MDLDTIRKLNAINRAFYATVADDFDATRATAWQGWQQLAPHLRRFERLRVLDVGCGNGRFGVFLQETLPHAAIDYHGIDNSEALLERAKIALPNATLEHRDIIEHPLDDNAAAYDLVVLFGVMHHVPASARRQALMRTLAAHVAPDGLLVFACWRFYELPRLRKRIVPFPPDITPEPNDYLLDWRRGNHALRYCHYVDDAEHDALITQSGLAPIADYRADGESGDLNRYTVLHNRETETSSDQDTPL